MSVLSDLLMSQDLMMASSTGTMGVDMNDVFNLELYSQIRVFMADSSREYVEFENFQHSEQRVLQSLAHKLELDYEYFKVSRIARISRSDVLASSSQHGVDMLAWPTNINSSVDPNGIFRSNSLNSSTLDEIQGITKNFFNSPHNTDNSIFPSSSPSSPVSTSFSSLQRNDSQHVSQAAQADLPSVPHFNAFPPYANQPIPSTRRVHWSPPVEGETLTAPLHVLILPPDFHVNFSSAGHATLELAVFSAMRLRVRRQRNWIVLYLKENFEGYSNDSLFNDFTNLETSAEKLMSNNIHSQTHSSNLESSNPHTNGDESLDQHSGPYIASELGNCPANQIEILSIQLQNPCFVNENFAEGVSFEPEVLEEINSIRILEDAGGLNAPDYVGSKHGLQGLKSSQDALSMPSSAPSSSCLDSISAYSGDKASVASGPMRRPRGTMSRMAKLGMNAVRKVGACWRCRFLRKPCDPKNPCALCPKGDRSKWELVGCRRGKFKPETPLAHLCQPPNTLLGSDLQHHLQEQEQTTAIFQQALQTREAWIRFSENEYLENLENQTLLSRASSSEAHPEVLAQYNTAKGFLIRFSAILRSMKRQPDLEVVQPLKQCVMAIVWEILECDYSRHILGSDGVLGELVCLLPSAALFQANFQGDELISQSLNCLLNSLEALRMKTTSFQSENLHFDCGGPSQCKVEWVANLSMNQSLYFRELSRVLFKKENSHDKTNWWLSTFYGFRIQCLVRKALLELTKDSEEGLLQSKHYLHIPLRLFIASSGTYDPLISDSPPLLQSIGDNSTPMGNDCEELKRAVGQSDWGSNGIFSSGDYLKTIYEDDIGLTPAERSAPLRPWNRDQDSDGDSLNDISRGSSFSDLDDVGVTQSALEEALASKMQADGGMASKMVSISQALRSKYL